MTNSWSWLAKLCLRKAITSTLVFEQIKYCCETFLLFYLSFTIKWNLTGHTNSTLRHVLHLHSARCSVKQSAANSVPVLIIQTSSAVVWVKIQGSAPAKFYHHQSLCGKTRCSREIVPLIMWSNLMPAQTEPKSSSVKRSTFNFARMKKCMSVFIHLND